jgi:hypothetical protein
MDVAIPSGFLRFGLVGGVRESVVTDFNLLIVGAASISTGSFSAGLGMGRLPAAASRTLISFRFSW